MSARIPRAAIATLAFAVSTVFAQGKHTEEQPAKPATPPAAEAPQHQDVPPAEMRYQAGSSPLKDAPHGFEPTSPEARAALDALVKDSYAWFKDLVKSRRGMDDAQRERSDPPEAFCSTEDWPLSASRPAIGVMLKNRSAILYDQHGNTAFTLRIFRGARAIGGKDFCNGGC